MPSLSQVVRNRAVVEIPVEGAPPLRIEYRVQGMTPRRMHELLAMLQEAQQAQEAQEAQTDAPDESGESATTEDQLARAQALLSAADDITRSLVEMIVNWNLTDDDGQPIPLTDEGMRDVDYDIQRLILDAIREDARLGKRNGMNSSTPSGSPSSPTGTQAKASSRRRSQRGTH